MLRLMLIAVLLSTTGCIQRRIRVTSEPPGAIVWLNDTEIGRTPTEAEFTFYGSYDVRLELDGYEPIHQAQYTRAPFHEYPGPDLIAEALPFKFDTLIEWHFDLEQIAERVQPPEQVEADLLDRAHEMQRQAVPDTTESDGPGSD
jgi:PEGA domain-containing protein